jgi:hypothetical protein
LFRMALQNCCSAWPSCFGELRVDVRRRRQRTLRAAGLSLKRERRESGD